MSAVTDVILTTAIDENKAFARLCAAIPDRFPPVAVHQHGTTGKAMQADVYLAAYNYLNLDQLVTAVEQADWETPEQVRLFINGEYDENGFHEVLLRLPGERRKIEHCDPDLHRAARKLSPGEEATLMKPPYYCADEGCRQRPMFLCYEGQLWCEAHIEVGDDVR